MNDEKLKKIDGIELKYHIQNNMDRIEELEKWKDLCYSDKGSITQISLNEGKIAVLEEKHYKLSNMFDKWYDTRFSQVREEIAELSKDISLELTKYYNDIGEGFTSRIEELEKIFTPADWKDEMNRLIKYYEPIKEEIAELKERLAGENEARVSAHSNNSEDKEQGEQLADSKPATLNIDGDEFTAEELIGLGKGLRDAELGNFVEKLTEPIFYCHLCKFYDTKKDYCSERNERPERYIHCPRAEYTDLAKYIMKRAEITTRKELIGEFLEKLDIVLDIDDLDRTILDMLLAIRREYEARLNE